MWHPKLVLGLLIKNVMLMVGILHRGLREGGGRVGSEIVNAIYNE